jgi:hypothetical protein
MYRKWPVIAAGPVWRFILTRCGFAGITMPWRRIYILPEWINDPTLIAHEQCHAMQCQRDGAWYFWPKICWDFFAYGYWDSPYEVEARAAAERLPGGYWSVHEPRSSFPI